MSSSGRSPALSPSSAKAALGAILALLREEPLEHPERQYAAAVRRFLEQVAAHLAVRRGLDAKPDGERALHPWLLDGAESPHQLLTDLYAALLGFSPVVEHGEIRLRPTRAETRRRGAYFTPPAIAREVTRHALAGAPHLPRVLDPAMGTGVFLLQAVKQLGGDAASVAERCVFGLDLDATAVRLAVLSLQLETGARAEVLERHLVHGDALSPHASLPDADVVLGNPPWGAGIGSEERDRLRQRFAAVARSFDSAKLFVDLGSERTRGTLGMVLPQAFAAQEKHADVREVLLERMAPRAALDLGDAFSGAAAPACALVFEQKPGRSRVEVTGGSLAAGLWTRSSFPLRHDEMLPVLHRLQRRQPLFADLQRRLRIRDVGLNYNRASVSRRSLYAAIEPEHALDRPYYRGRDFARYTPVRRGGWLRHDAEERLLPGESLSYGRDTAALPAKIVLRQTADRLIATLDRSRMVMGRSVIAVVAEEPRLLLPVLALLNSAPATALYRALAGETGRILPQVKVARLQALPLPSLDVEGGQWAELGRLAQRLLDRGGDDREAEDEVDSLVARMYGLSTAETRLVLQGS